MLVKKSDSKISHDFSYRVETIYKCIAVKQRRGGRNKNDFLEIASKIRKREWVREKRQGSEKQTTYVIYEYQFPRTNIAIMNICQ